MHNSQDEDMDITLTEADDDTTFLLSGSDDDSTDTFHGFKSNTGKSLEEYPRKKYSKLLSFSDDNEDYGNDSKSDDITPKNCEIITISDDDLDEIEEHHSFPSRKRKLSEQSTHEYERQPNFKEKRTWDYEGQQYLEKESQSNIIGISDEDNYEVEQNHEVYESPRKNKLPVAEYWTRSKKAKPPILVDKNLQTYDIDISNMHGNYSYVSYWGLPFHVSGNVDIHSSYLRYLTNDKERMQNLISLSGKVLGCHNMSTTHGFVLLDVFKSMKYTKKQVEIYKKSSKNVPKFLNDYEVEDIISAKKKALKQKKAMGIRKRRGYKENLHLDIY